MSQGFLKFKNKTKAIRTLTSLMLALSVGLLVGGVLILLGNFSLLPFGLPIAIAIAAAVGGVTFCAVFILTEKTDRALAHELDGTFSLKEKVQTMLAYRGKNGEMIELQRMDAEQRLSEIPTKAYKFSRLPVYIIALVIALAAFITAFFIKPAPKADTMEPETPFEFTEIQRIAMNELIDRVSESEMEEQFRAEIVAELRALYSVLETVTTENAMKREVGDSVLKIHAVTCASSSTKELAEAMWSEELDPMRSFAMMLDSSKWVGDGWDSFCSASDVFRDEFIHPDASLEVNDEGKMAAEISGALLAAAFGIETALDKSGISDGDALYRAIYDFAFKSETDSNVALGLERHGLNITTDGYYVTDTAINNTFLILGGAIFDALDQAKINSDTGEYAMERLSSLFGVALPAFERPQFSTAGSGGTGDSVDDDKNTGADGGLGDGAVFGSEDIVLDSSTDTYVEYGTLLDKYNAIMMEKMESGEYTEEQLDAVRKYFSILYNGFEEESEEK